MEIVLIKKTMTSKEIAEYTGKQHAHVMRDIREMEAAWEKVSQSKFGLAEYIDEQGKKRPMYQLTKTECLYIATKFNDEARAKLILRWEQLETQQQHQIPQNFAEALKLAALQAEEIEINKRQLQEQKPKVLFADAVSASEKSILIYELAKLLKQNGYEIGGNRLFAELRSQGYLCSRGESYNQPTQQAMNMGLFEIKKTSILKPDGTTLVNSTTKVTPKGQIYFVNKFLANTKMKVVLNS